MVKFLKYIRKNDFKKTILQKVARRKNEMVIIVNNISGKRFTFWESVMIIKK